MTRFMGVDPDLHSTAIAIVDHEGKVAEVRVVKSNSEGNLLAVSAMIDALTACDMWHRLVTICAIESQEIVYTSGKGANPRDLCRLANISGACAALAQGCGTRHLLITPGGWKGTVPKAIHHARIFDKLGWKMKKMGGKNGYGSPVDFGASKGIYGKPIGAESLNPGDWKHVTDAIGLALWVRDLHNTPLQRKGKGYDERMGP